MKILRLIISFLLVATTASVVVAGEKEVVVDVYGNPVKANTPYYVDSEEVPREGFTRFRIDMTRSFLSCPQRVVFKTNRFDLVGVVVPPIIFVSSSDFIRVSTELNIKFAGPPSQCNESGFWRVPDSSLRIKEVVLSGSESSNDSTFTITKLSDQYKFAFGSAENSTDVSLVPTDLGLFRLILRNEPSYGFSFSFVPASDSDSALAL